MRQLRQTGSGNSHDQDFDRQSPEGLLRDAPAGAAEGISRAEAWQKARIHDGHETELRAEPEEGSRPQEGDNCQEADDAQDHWRQVRVFEERQASWTPTRFGDEATHPEVSVDRWVEGLCQVRMFEP